jgi:hypothetical protein
MLQKSNLRTCLGISVFFLTAAGLAQARTITIGPGAGCDFSAIQAGIDAANDGDMILVAPGEYVITEPVTYRGKAVIVKSEAGPEQDTIRMDTPADINRGSVVIFENGETTASVLEGFTITGGEGSLEASRNEWVGGGIVFYASSGTVRNCAIVQNRAMHGGGVFCFDQGSAELIDCTIAGNSAELGWGGGVLAYSGSSLSLSNCIIRNNAATGSMYGTGCGGGVCCFRGSSMTMTDCTVAENSAGNTGGGVLSAENSSMTVTRCVIVGNTSAQWCGGAAGWNAASTTIINCTICENSAVISGGGLGCYDRASATVTNSIICGNRAANGPDIYLDQFPAELSITYSNVAGGQTGVSVEGGTLEGGALYWRQGNIDTDPYFADPDNNDYHLKSEAGRWDPTSQIWVLDDVSSPCIDAGDANGSVAFEPYPNGGIINMGANGGTAEASKSPSGLHSKYGGGTGEPNDPYLLYTDEHLNALGAEPNDYDKHFKLMADIDLSRYTYDRAVIAPDTNDANTDFDGTPFTGVLEGNNHIISRLTIVGESYLGLFGGLESGATVSNLGLEAVDVNGMGDHVGGLVGLNYEDSNITNCYSTGTVTGGEYVAGLVGSSIRGGSITASHSTGAVTGDRFVGGLVGCNDSFLLFAGPPETPPSRVSDCFSNSTVTGTEHVGGLVGVNYDQGSITSSYSTGAVRGEKYVGGLVGWNGSWGVSGLPRKFPGSTVADCFSNSTVTGGESGGGLVGVNYDEGSITNSYSTGAVSGDDNVGGLVGENYSVDYDTGITNSYSIGAVRGDRNVGGLVGNNSYGNVVNCFWDTETNGQVTSTCGTGKTTAEMQKAGTFLEAGWDFVDETENGAENIWWIDEGQDYPRLWWELPEEDG